MFVASPSDRVAMSVGLQATEKRETQSSVSPRVATLHATPDEFGALVWSPHRGLAAAGTPTMRPLMPAGSNAYVVACVVMVCARLKRGKEKVIGLLRRLQPTCKLL